MYVKHLELSTPIPIENISHLWEQNNILILLINLKDYNIPNVSYLNASEKKRLESLKTSYFRKRYIVSRSALKHILQNIPDYSKKDQSISKICTYSDEYGEVHIRSHKELHICISYTGSIISLAVSKVKMGIDIELRKMISLGKMSKYLQTADLKTDNCEDEFDILTVWTLKEAYCKFSNKSMLSILNKELDLSDVFHASYNLSNKYVLSVVTEKNPCSLNITCLSKIELLEKLEAFSEEI